MLDIAAICLAVTALLAYVNHRFVGLPTTVGVMAIAMLITLGLAGLNALGLAQQLASADRALLESIDFSEVLLQGMLSLLLFAGAMHVDLPDLRAYAWQVSGLAVLATVASAALVGFGLWLVLPLAGLTLPLVHCLLFGALISPTDPVAVIGIMKTTKVPKALETVISGESLFNDGVGVVLFALLAGVAHSGTTPSVAQGLELLLREAGGGLAFGWVLGSATYWLLKSVDQYQVEVLLTLAAVVGGYALAGHLHVSGPLAMVVAGVMIGNRGRAEAMSETTRQYVDMFWELIDEILNAVLFVLLGMAVLLFPFGWPLLVGGALAVLVTLVARLVTVGLPVAALHKVFGLPPGSWRVLTWGGLRGGISVALAFSLPTGPERELVLALTYCVVVVSILGQGLTIGRVIRGVCAPEAPGG